MRKAEEKKKWEEFQETAEMLRERSKVERWMRLIKRELEVRSEVDRRAPVMKGDDNSTAKVVLLMT